MSTHPDSHRIVYSIMACFLSLGFGLIAGVVMAGGTDMWPLVIPVSIVVTLSTAVMLTPD